jgi:FAD/FMN-containing dehydrogenase
MSQIEVDARAAALRDQLTGRVVAVGDAGWDAARQAFNLALDQRPELVAFPADADDVARVVRFAAERGLRVAAQRTGHNARPLGALDGTVLVNPAALDAVELDAGARRARVGAGARWQDVVPAASELGLAALHGSAPNVGIVGYSLGGGVGWYARKHGIATNRVTAVELVTAAGDRVRVDAEHDAELFWALRGGGGGFGIVTALEFELLDQPSVHAGALFFAFERAAEILHAWREWTAALPDEVTSVGRVMQFPPLPEVPEPLRGSAFAVVEVVCLTDAAQGDELLAPLRALGPAIDTVATVPPAEIAELHMDPPEPVPYIGQHQLLGALPARAIDDLLAVAGPGSGSPLLSVELRHLGGAAARRAEHHGALAAIDAPFLELAVGMAMDADGAAAVAAACGRVADALAPYDAGARYLNFLEEPTDPTTFYDDETVARLRAVKARVDPAGTIRANHELAAAG